MSTHEEHEDHAWTIAIGDHAARTETPVYNRSRKLMIKAVQEASAAAPWYFGEPPYQDHHGGGVWVKSADGPLLFLLPAGMEWSSQFCADPAKVDRLRTWAQALVQAFPDTDAWYTSLGMTKADRAILETPIVDAATIAAWTDSFWNASVPLPATMHTGVIPHGAGYHHYPKPIVDISLFKHDDFTLFVTAEDGSHVAVAPIAPRGSGVDEVQVLYATPGTPLAEAHHDAHHAGDPLVLDGSSPLAKQAFARQTD